MTAEYLIVGAILVLMGGTQVYLRHGGGGEAARAGSARAADAPRRDTSRVWKGWTGILGFVSVAVGLAFVVAGLLGA